MLYIVIEKFMYWSAAALLIIWLIALVVTIIIPPLNLLVSASIFLLLAYVRVLDAIKRLVARRELTANRCPYCTAYVELKSDEEILCGRCDSRFNSNGKKVRNKKENNFDSEDMAGIE